MRLSIRAAWIVSLLCSGVLAVDARADLIGPSPYLCFDADATTATGNCSGKDSPFKGVELEWFYFKDFEDQVVASPGVTMIANCNVTAHGCPYIATRVFPATSTDSVDEDDGAIDGFGRTVNGRGQTIYADRMITFTFDAGVLGSLPTHAGVVWTDGGSLTSTRFEAWDASGLSLGTIVATFADSSNAGTTGEDRFLGAIHPEGISAIRVENSVGGIEMDHLQYGGGDPPPRWIGFGAVLRRLPTGNTPLAEAGVQEILVRWDTIVGIMVPGDTVGQGSGAVRGAESPWVALGGFAELSLTRENLRFSAEGLVLATGDAIGTPGYVTEVLGTLVCDTDGSVGGDSVVVETPLVPVDKHGGASFNGSVSPLPAECYSEPDIAFLVRVPPPSVEVDMAPRRDHGPGLRIQR